MGLGGLKRYPIVVNYPYGWLTKIMVLFGGPFLILFRVPKKEP